MAVAGLGYVAADARNGNPRIRVDIIAAHRSLGLHGISRHGGTYGRVPVTATGAADRRIKWSACFLFLAVIHSRKKIKSRFDE